MWGREMRAVLLFVVAALLVGGSFREWRRSHERPFQDLVARLEAGEAARADSAADGAGPSSDAQRVTKPPAREPERGPRIGGIDPDEANAGELIRLPGIGPALASRIVAEREARGPYRTAEALLRVPGIGPRILDRIRPYLVFGAPVEKDSLSRF